MAPSFRQSRLASGVLIAVVVFGAASVEVAGSAPPGNGEIAVELLTDSCAASAARPARAAPEASAADEMCGVAADGVTLVTPSGGRRRRVAAASATGSPVFSPTGRRLALSSLRHLFVASPITARAQAVFTSAYGGLIRPGPWSPDGARIAIGAGRLVIVRLDGREPDVVRLPGPAWAVAPLAWSTTGKLAVSCYRDEDPKPCGGLYVVAQDGRGWRRVYGPGSGYHTFLGKVRWSPDGARLAYTPDADRRLRIADLRTRHTTVLSRGAFPVDWLPGGRRLLTRGDRGLQVVTITGGRPRTTTLMRDTGEAALSPDGRRIVLVRGSAVYVSDVSGRNARRILTLGQADPGRRNGLFAFGTLSWQPAPR